MSATLCLEQVLVSANVFSLSTPQIMNYTHVEEHRIYITKNDDVKLLSFEKSINNIIYEKQVFIVVSYISTDQLGPEMSCFASFEFF